MSRLRISVIVFFMLLGLAACALKEVRTEISEGLVTSTGQPQPSKTPFPVTPTKTFIPSDTPIPAFTNTSTPTLTPTPLTCWSEGGRIEQREFPSDWLSDTIQTRVYFPPCYDQQLDRRYPVIYLLHGITYNDDQWDRLGVDETADDLIAAGELSPFMMVMPREELRRTPAPANLFDKALVEDLLPRIDADYRTIPVRRYRAIGGLSRGGNWAVHIGFMYWGFFGKVGAHSAPIFYADRPLAAQKWFSEIPIEEMPMIYMDAGDEDVWLSLMLEFEDLLNQKDIPHEWHLFPGQHHEEYWASHLEQYLRWYAHDW